MLQKERHYISEIVLHIHTFHPNESTPNASIASISVDPLLRVIRVIRVIRDSDKGHLLFLKLHEVLRQGSNMTKESVQTILMVLIKLISGFNRVILILM